MQSRIGGKHWILVSSRHATLTVYSTKVCTTACQSRKLSDELSIFILFESTQRVWVLGFISIVSPHGSLTIEGLRRGWCNGGVWIWWQFWCWDWEESFLCSGELLSDIGLVVVMVVKQAG